ncbi:hypothetical protein MYX82_01535 [Acidobacteria bacterium AH-259-D05]|nr:hypothetical protein [Acidobacteria bacterium AH-259-D05]
MKTLASFLSLFTLCTLFALFALSSPQSSTPAYQELKEQAEQLYAEGSYRRAHELYLRAKELALPASEALWVSFRVADTQWRAQAATQTFDNTQFEEARRQVEALITDERQGNPVWVEAQQSLGDFWWIRRDSRNWGSAWTHYQKALQWWADSKDIATARGRSPCWTLCLT